MPSTSAKQAKFMKAVANNPKFAKKVGVAQSVGKDFEMADKKMKKFNSGGAAKKPKPPMPREPITGGPDTVPMTPERREFLKELERRNKQARDAGAAEAKKSPDYNRAKGGKIMDKAKGAAKTRKFADGGAASATFGQKLAATRAKQAEYVARRDAAQKAKMQPAATATTARPAATATTARPAAAAPNPATRQQRAADAVKRYTDAMGRYNSAKPTMKEGGKVMKKSDKAGRALVKKSADTMGRAMKMNKGGKCYAKGGSIDGIAKKGKTRGKMC